MTFTGVPNSFVNGTTADAPSVNADFDAVTTGLNNIDAGQVTTGTLPIGRGGTGSATEAGAAANILGAPLFTSSNPTSGGTTTSATDVMFGLNTTFTPATTGKMKLTVTGTLTMGTATQAYTLKLRSAAGAAPVFNAAGSGTVLSAATWNGESTSQQIQFSLTGIITLTAGVAAWVDVSAATSSGAGAAIGVITAIIDEKPI